MNNLQLIELLNDLVKQPNESEWVEFKLNFHSDEETGERFKIVDQNAAIASRIIRDTLVDGVIKEDDPESKSRKYASYIPFWA
jgi:hypothetical protein